MGGDRRYGECRRGRGEYSGTYMEVGDAQARGCRAARFKAFNYEVVEILQLMLLLYALTRTFAVISNYVI